MFVTKCEFAIFAVYTQKDLFYEHVPYDEELVKLMLVHFKLYFIEVIMPEMLGKHFTTTKNTPIIAKNNVLPCYCQKDLPQNPKRLTIRCSNELCVIRVFHRECVEFSRGENVNNWVCKFCKAEVKKRSQKQKRTEAIIKAGKKPRSTNDPSSNFRVPLKPINR